MSKSILIRGGRVIDPSQEIDEKMDVLIVGDKIAGLGREATGSADEVIDADGPCGGYNLHMCFATGLLAGRSAARSLSS